VLKKATHRPDTCDRSELLVLQAPLVWLSDAVSRSAMLGGSACVSSCLLFVDSCVGATSSVGADVAAGEPMRDEPKLLTVTEPCRVCLAEALGAWRLILICDCCCAPMAAAANGTMLLVLDLAARMPTPWRCAPEPAGPAPWRRSSLLTTSACSSLPASDSLRDETEVMLAPDGVSPSQNPPLPLSCRAGSHRTAGDATVLSTDKLQKKGTPWKPFVLSTFGNSLVQY